MANGIGAKGLNTIIGKGSVVSAGALIPEGKTYPERSLIMGVPGKVIRQVSDELYKSTIHFSKKYVNVKNEYQGSFLGPDGY